MTTGQNVFGSIRSHFDTLSSEQAGISRQIYEAEGSIQALVAERENIILRLAQMYLPELSAQSVVATLKDVQQRVQDCFQQKQDRRKTLEASIKSLRQKRGDSQTVIDRLTREFDLKSGERHSAEDAIAAQLQAGTAYQDTRRLADQNQIALDGAKARAKSFSAEAAKKLSAYESEPLFQYLVRIGHGTGNHRVGALAAMGDNWIASMVEFRDNKRNYDQLKALPKFIDEEIQRQQAGLDRIVGELRRIEDQAGKAFRLQMIISEGQTILDRRQQAQQCIAPIDADLTNATRELQSLDGAKDEFHRQALIQMKDFLRGQSIATLKEKAREMPGTEDDQLVQRMEQIESAIAANKEKSNQLKAQQHQGSHRLSELAQLQSWYSQNGYESARSRFTSQFDIASLLGGFVLGNIASSVLRSLIQKHQSYLPDPGYRRSSGYSTTDSGTDSGWGFGGWSLGSGGGNSSDWGGSSGGGWSSSDSISSGGYSSTDSF